MKKGDHFTDSTFVGGEEPYMKPMERSGQMDSLVGHLGFRITDVQISDDKVLRRLDYVSSGCRPATSEECKLWDMLALISWKRRII